MRLVNTTGNQDSLLDSEFAALRRLDFDPRVIESILDDLDQRLSRVIEERDNAATSHEEETRELQTRVSELGNELSQRSERIEELERQQASLEDELRYTREHSEQS